MINNFFVIKSARNGRQNSGCSVEQKTNTWTKQGHLVISLYATPPTMKIKTLEFGPNYIFHNFVISANLANGAVCNSFLRNVNKEVK